MTAATILTALSCGNAGCPCQVSMRREKGLTHCLSHSDSTPSLNVEERDGATLVKCHGGCEQATVIADLRARDLWTNGLRVINGGAKESSKVVDVYDYVDRDGKLLFQVVRYA